MDALKLLRPKLLRARKLWTRPTLAVIAASRFAAAGKERKSRRAPAVRLHLVRLFITAVVAGWCRSAVKCRREGLKIGPPTPTVPRRQVAKRSRTVAEISDGPGEPVEADEQLPKKLKISDPKTLEEQKIALHDLIETEDEVAHCLFRLLEMHRIFRPFVDVRNASARPTAVHRPTDDDYPSNATRQRIEMKACQGVTPAVQMEQIRLLMERHPEFREAVFQLSRPWRMVVPSTPASAQPLPAPVPVELSRLDSFRFKFRTLGQNFLGMSCFNLGAGPLAELYPRCAHSGCAPTPRPKNIEPCWSDLPVSWMHSPSHTAFVRQPGPAR